MVGAPTKTATRRHARSSSSKINRFQYRCQRSTQKICLSRCTLISRTLEGPRFAVSRLFCTLSGMKKQRGIRQSLWVVLVPIATRTSQSFCYGISPHGQRSVGSQKRQFSRKRKHLMRLSRYHWRSLLLNNGAGRGPIQNLEATDQPAPASNTAGEQTGHDGHAKAEPATTKPEEPAKVKASHERPKARSPATTKRCTLGYHNRG